MIQLLIFALFLSLPVWALESYQGEDYKVTKSRCGAPLIEALRKSDPEHLLDDPKGNLNFKESLERISLRNLQNLKYKLGALSSTEKAIIDLIESRFPAPIVHRTDVESIRRILTGDKGLVSSTKRHLDGKTTPVIEQSLFSGFDCVYTSVGLSFGIEQYGPVIIRIKEKQGFFWGTMLTGFTWNKEILKRGQETAEMDDRHRREFSRFVFTNNHWDEALGLQIISLARYGTSIRGLGVAYDKNTILSELLSQKTRGDFWSKVIRHRLAYFEGHTSDFIPREDFEFVQFRLMDAPVIYSYKFSDNWFKSNYLQFFNRNL